MHNQSFRTRVIPLIATIILFTTGYGCTNNTNLPINTAGSRKFTIDFPSEIMDRASIQKNAEMTANYIDSCSLIQLETRPECLIGEINKIFFYKNRLYILDREVTKSVFIFDLNGKWISTIDRFPRKGFVSQKVHSESDS